MPADEEQRSRAILLDGESFGQAISRRPLAVRHSLANHPLLRLNAITELAERLPAVSVEQHEAKQPLVVSGGAPGLRHAAVDTVRGIETNGRWLVLWYIEQVPEYAALLDALDPIQRHVPRHEGGICQREAFLFLSAPGALTPVHFDAEHNFLLQIRGTKTMHVCEFPDAAGERSELERYYDGGDRNLDAVPSSGTTFRLSAGDGVYVYPFAPHWVRNGDDVSVSLSLTFRTGRSRRAELAHAFDARVRRRVGIRMRPPGGGRLSHRVKATAELAVRRVRPVRLPHHGC